MIRVREDGAQSNRPGGLVNGHVGELKRTGLREFDTVAGHRVDLRFAVFLFQRTICQLLLQAQEVIAGLGHIDINRVQLLHCRQRRRLTVLYQRAFRYG